MTALIVNSGVNEALKLLFNNTGHNDVRIGIVNNTNNDFTIKYRMISGDIGKNSTSDIIKSTLWAMSGEAKGNGCEVYLELYDKTNHYLFNIAVITPPNVENSIKIWGHKEMSNSTDHDFKVHSKSFSSTNMDNTIFKANDGLKTFHYSEYDFTIGITNVSPAHATIIFNEN